ncbi:MAG: hypothetical protein K2X02_07315 [Alphaproteobacteria bacterium]|nr:hypothetical protein [Alphaproteobacteria bacterium]
MKKVSVFTVLTCFLAGTANLSCCYAGNLFGKPDEPVDDGRSKGIQPKSSPPAGRGAGRGSVPAQPPMSAGRGASRGSVPAQSPTSVGQGAGRGAIPSTQPKPGPYDSQIPQFEGTFDDVGAITSSKSTATEMSEAESALYAQWVKEERILSEGELALYAQWVKEGKVPGIALIQPASSQPTVPTASKPVEAGRGEELSRLTMPSSYATPLPSLQPTVSSVHGLEGGERAEQLSIPSSSPTPLPTSSSLVLEETEQLHTSSPSSSSFFKNDNTVAFFTSSGITIAQKENHKVAKVSLLCTLIEWRSFSEAARNVSIRKLYEQKPEIDIAQLNNGVKWAKFYLTKRGKAQKKDGTASAFSQLIEARMSQLIKEIETSILLNEEPSVQIRFLQDKANEKILFSVQRNLGEVILVEIPGQE